MTSHLLPHLPANFFRRKGPQLLFLEGQHVRYVYRKSSEYLTQDLTQEKVSVNARSFAWTFFLDI